MKLYKIVHYHKSWPAACKSLFVGMSGHKGVKHYGNGWKEWEVDHTKWYIGQTNSIIREMRIYIPRLCTDTVFHAYLHPLQLYYAPVHGFGLESLCSYNFLECEGEVQIKDASKVGVHDLTPLRVINMSSEQKEALTGFKSPLYRMENEMNIGRWEGLSDKGYFDFLEAISPVKINDLATDERFPQHENNSSESIRGQTTS